jgi:peptidyl-prolyl cis-trans isomerase D
MAVIGKIRNQAGLIIGLIGLSLVAFILGDLLKSNSSFLQGSGTDVAVIAGEKISYQEYEQSVQQMTETYKQNSNTETVDQSTTDMLREQAWNQLVREKVMNKEFEKMNITVSPEELFQMTTGKDPHPSVKQAFTDPKTGQFDPANVIKFLKEKDKDPSGKTAERWVAFEKAIIMERISQKYNNLIKQGLYVTSDQAKEEYLEKEKNAKMQFILLNYASIVDSTVKVSDAELNTYYKAHEKEHKQEASRKIEYVTFDVSPSEEDRKMINERVNKQVAEFKEAKDDSTYVRLNSDNPNVDMTYHKKGTLPLAVDSAFFNAGIGKVVGPYIENNELKVSKLSDVRMIPDSAKARHILLKVAQGENPAKVMAKADSLKKLIQGGANFEELAKKFSEDPGSAIKGGDLGWFKDGMMVKPFNDACLKGKKGDMPIVASQFGIHLIQILDLGNPIKKVKVVTISRKLEPSTKTSRAIFARANEFAGKNRTGESFEKAIVDQKLNKRIADNLKENDRTIPGLESPREMIRWAFKSNKGEISPKVFEMGDKYVVAHLSVIREKGFATLEQIKTEMEAGAKKDKKAVMLKEKAGEAANGATTIENIAAKLKTQVQLAENVTFANPNLQGAGREPAVVGSAFALKQGAISKPIEGNSGVYIVVVTNYSVPPALKDYAATKNQMLNNIKSRSDYELFNALKEKAQVEDNRGRFY